MSVVLEQKNLQSDTEQLREMQRIHLQALEVWCEMGREFGLKVSLYVEDDANWVIDGKKVWKPFIKLSADGFSVELMKAYMEAGFN